MVFVAMKFFGSGGVDDDLEFAIGSEAALAFHDDFGRVLLLRPPPPAGWTAAPCAEPGIPIVIVAKPPVARAVEPIPWPHRIPSGIMRTALHLVLHRRFRHRCAEEIRRTHRRLHLVTKGHRISWRIDLHLEFRLPVFLDAETAVLPESIRMLVLQTVDPKDRSRIKRERFSHATKGIGGHFLLKYRFATGIEQSDRELRASILRTVLGFVIACEPGPCLPMDGLPRPVNRSVGHRDDLPLMEFLLILSGKPHRAESKVREAAVRGRCGDQPLHVLPELIRLAEELPDLVGEFGEAPRLHIELSPSCLLKRLHPVAEEIEGGLANGSTTHGIGHVVLLFIDALLVHDGGIGEPDDAADAVAACDDGFDEVCAGRLQRGGEFHAPVPMLRPRLKGHFPLRHFRPQVLLHVFLGNPVANAPNIEAAPVKVGGIFREPLPRVIKQFPHLHRTRRQRHLVPIPKNIAKLRARSCRTHLRSIKAAPRLHNLIELRLP